MEIAARLWTLSWSHIASHLSYFSGVSMLLPTLSTSFHIGQFPWFSYPTMFFIAVVLILLGIIILFLLEKSIGKLLRSVGWMMIIPGIVAFLFAAVTSDAVFAWMNNSITGFHFVEPAVHYLVEHSVPTTMNVAAGYMIFGMIFLWLGKKVARIAHYL